MSSNTQTTATKEEDTPALVPKLRFPEFRNKAEWRIKKLNELLFETKTRNRSLELGPADVLSVSGEHGCVNQIEFMGRSYAGVTVKDYHVVEHGDVVYTKSPLKKNPFGIIKENKGKRGIVSTLYAVYRPFPDCSASYLDHFFSGDYNLNAYLQPIVKKGAKNDMKVNNADVLKGDICVPDLPEQQKIAECLSSVDELMAAQARKLDALKTHKKGLMQQLFPREGETQPRLRFSNRVDWAVVALPEVAFFQEGPGIMAVDFHSEGVPLVRLAGVSGPVVTLDGCNYLDPAKVAQKWTHFRLEVNDLLISTSATFGLSSLVTKAAAGAVFYTGLIRFRPSSERLDRGYLKIFLGSPHFGRQVETAAVGGGIKHFGPSHLKQMEIPIPPLDEQQRIAMCLSSLDALITAETQKLEALKIHKKGLMQQLFPNMETCHDDQ